MTTLNYKNSQTLELSRAENEFSQRRHLKINTDIGQLCTSVRDLKMHIITNTDHWDVSVLNELFDKADGIFEAYISVIANRIAHLESTTEDRFSRYSEFHSNVI